MTISDCLKKNLKRLRKERGLTQQELANACKLSLATIQIIESGKVYPEESSIAVIAKALNVEQTVLFFDSELIDLKQSVDRVLIALNLEEGNKE